ncbi:MAG TPA: hypothetical protein VKY74_09545 [Chloroflexia bacterium]|nr:hypothetical protein [Chloroflexia bacterium]
MLSNELLSALHKLDHADKLRAMQFLVGELAREEDALLPPGTLYEVWSPYDAPAAADALLKMLEENEQRRAS